MHYKQNCSYKPNKLKTVMFYQGSVEDIYFCTTMFAKQPKKQCLIALLQCVALTNSALKKQRKIMAMFRSAIYIIKKLTCFLKYQTNKLGTLHVQTRSCISLKSVKTTTWD